jgi:DNA-binding FrmR family transcriptional regulator
MSTGAKETAKLANRLKRIRGQIKALEQAVEDGKPSGTILQQATSCRGALNGFIVKVIEKHIREQVVDPAASRQDPRALAADELVEVIQAYLT